MGQSCPAQWAWSNAPINTEIHRSEKKLFPDYSFKLINSPHKRVWKKVVRMRFWERELPGSSQEWGKSGLRLKSWFLSELAIAAGLGSNGASHPGTLKYVCTYVCMHTYVHTYMHTCIHQRPGMRSATRAQPSCNCQLQEKSTFQSETRFAPLLTTSGRFAFSESHSDNFFSNALVWEVN